MRALMICVLLVTSSCASRIETMRYTSDTIPKWILEEWDVAQYELLQLPSISADPRRFSPYEWEWIQMEQEFWVTDDDGERKRVLGWTQPSAKQIIICCGDRTVVRHEAFHAILWRMHDPRYKMHYPELKEMLR